MKKLFVLFAVLVMAAVVTMTAFAADCEFKGIDPTKLAAELMTLDREYVQQFHSTCNCDKNSLEYDNCSIARPHCLEVESKIECLSSRLGVKPSGDDLSVLHAALESKYGLRYGRNCKSIFESNGVWWCEVDFGE